MLLPAVHLSYGLITSVSFQIHQLALDGVGVIPSMMVLL